MAGQARPRARTGDDIREPRIRPTEAQRRHLGDERQPVNQSTFQRLYGYPCRLASRAIPMLRSPSGVALNRCAQALERALADGVPLIRTAAPVCFCRSDARFANVIARPDGRVELVDWEDSGLRDPARELVDLLHHPNQEDLIDAEGGQPFLDRYLPGRSADTGFGERVRGYLALFPVFWLGVLLTEGLRRAASGTLQGWLINDLEPNQRLRRYVARGLAWPAIDPTSRLSDVADNITFF